jgi:hypothetical protein
MSSTFPFGKKLKKVKGRNNMRNLLSRENFGTTEQVQLKNNVEQIQKNILCIFQNTGCPYGANCSYLHDNCNFNTFSNIPFSNFCCILKYTDQLTIHALSYTNKRFYKLLCPKFLLKNENLELLSKSRLTIIFKKYLLTSPEKQKVRKLLSSMD